MAEASSSDKFQATTKVVDGVTYALVDGGWKAIREAPPAAPALTGVAGAIQALQRSREEIAAAETEKDDTLRAIASGPADVARANDLKGEIESKAADLESSAARTQAIAVRVEALRARKAQLEAQGR